jgi:RNA recognition motif-containing protein
VSTKPNDQPQRQIFIGNLSYEATEKELAACLEAATIHVFRVRIVTSQDTQRPRGFAFVDIDRDDMKTVEEIIDIINGPSAEGPLILHGRPLRADKAKQRSKHSGGDKPPRAEKPKGGRGQAPNEFRRGRNEFEE